MKEYLFTVTKSANQRKLWRSVLTTLLILIVPLVLAACGGSEEPTATPEPTVAAEAAAPTDTAEPEAPPTPEAAQPAAEAPIASAQVPLEIASRANKYPSLPEYTLTEGKYYYATLKTVQGDIKVQLFADRAPATVNSFVFLAREGYYNNTTFHRVLDGFMAQAGDPTGTGAGGPGYQFEDEINEGLVFDRPNLLAMANAGPGTNGSQFFITFAPVDWLNGKHTIFGEVIEGTDVLPKLTRRDPSQNPDFLGDELISVTIEESDTSTLPTPLPPTPTPTPYAPSSVDPGTRPLSAVAAAEKSNIFNSAPEVVVEAKVYTGTIVTSQGTLTVELRGDVAPIAVNNFVLLANLGFYDNTPINLVQAGQYAIIGAPANTPDSDAGYEFAPETNVGVTPDVGYLAFIPRRQGADFIFASSSQIIVTLAAPPESWNLQYGFFGKITEGIDVLNSLTVSDTIQSMTVQQ